MSLQATEQLERFLRYLATERRFSPHTASAYRLDLSALMEWCDGTGVEDWESLEASHVRTFAAFEAFFEGAEWRSIV